MQIPQRNRAHEQSNTINWINKIVYGILKRENLLRGEWHVGVVDVVVSQYLLRVFVDGSTSSQPIPCNPDVTFKSGDHVFVHFVNGNSKDKFVPYKRAVH